MIAAVHSTEPWYFAIPVVVLGVGGRLFLRARRRGGFRQRPDEDRPLETQGGDGRAPQ